MLTAARLSLPFVPEITRLAVGGRQVWQVVVLPCLCPRRNHLLRNHVLDDRGRLHRLGVLTQVPRAISKQHWEEESGAEPLPHL